MFYISIFQKWFCWVASCCSSKRCKQKITWASEWVMKWFELTKCSLFYCQTLLILKWFVDRYNLFPLSLLQVSLSCLPSKFLSLWRPLLHVKVSTYSLLLSLTHSLIHSLHRYYFHYQQSVVVGHSPGRSPVIWLTSSKSPATHIPPKLMKMLSSWEERLGR